MKRILLASLIGISTTHAQQGDKRDNKPQVDPIPASEIPPAPILTPEQALKTIQLADGFSIKNIADSNVHQPVCLSFDADGRAWVVEMTQFMIDVHGSDENLPTGRIKILEDSTGDGVLDKTTIFLDKLVLPRAAAVTSDGLLYAHQDQLFFIKRGGENGLQPIGEPELIDAEYAAGGNAEHKPNGLLLARDNWYYNAKSEYRYRRVNGKWLKQKTAFRGQWGITQDNAGRLFFNTNSNYVIGDQMRPNLYRQNPNYIPKHKINHKVGSNATYSIRINPGVNRAYLKDTLNPDGTLKNCTAACGLTIYRGDNFPAEFQDVAFIAEPSANLIKAIKVTRDETNKPSGTFPYGKNEFLASTDEWFRPVNIYTAPDGTLWFIDMSCGLLQHKAYMTTYLRKQYESRGLNKPEENNGRIYRISYDKNKIKAVPQLSKSTIAELSSHLNHPNGTIRDTAQRLLVERITSSDDTQLTQWSKLKVPTDSMHALQQLHTLWVYEATGHIPADLILSSLSSTDSDVVNSALELAHLSDPQKVAPAVLSLRAKKQTVHSHLFALAKIASEKSHIKALDTIKEFNKVPQIKPLYVGALGLGVIKTADYQAAKDSGLKKLLAEAIDKSEHVTIVKAPPVPKAFAKNYQEGKKLYLGAAACSACHGLEGQGQEGLLPPLAPSNWVNADKEIMAKVILTGLTGTIHVNGEKYATGQFMPARPDLTDQQIADLMVYIKHMKGNKGGTITANEIKAIRQATKDRTAPYTEADLMPAK
ncbi:MAG: DUF7133 domain-containing protein [Akkermansiaceae bacterium]